MLVHMLTCIHSEHARPVQLAVPREHLGHVLPQVLRSCTLSSKPWQLSESTARECWLPGALQRTKTTSSSHAEQKTLSLSLSLSLWQFALLQITVGSSTCWTRNPSINTLPVFTSPHAKKRPFRLHEIAFLIYPILNPAILALRNRK